MLPFMISLRPLCRILLLVWLVLVVGMSVLVAQATRTEVSGNLLAFLLNDRPQPQSPMPVSPPLPASLPVPPPTQQSQVIPQSIPEWKPLPRGKAQGSGVLKGPEVTERPDGSVQVVFTYEGVGGKPGDPGAVTAIKVSSRSTSVDLHGPWKRVAYLNKTGTGRALLARLQVAEHKGYVRVSATAHGSAPEETTEYTADRIRIIFSRPGEAATSGGKLPGGGR